MTTEAVQAAASATSRQRKATGRLDLSIVMRHPVAISFAVALAIRVVAAVTITNVGGYLFPDEQGYVLLGRLASAGNLTPSVESGYGEYLFHTAASFMWPVTVLFAAFGDHAVVAALWAAIFGAGAAGLTALLVGRVIGGMWAAIGGLAVATFPSQILWSSVVLRESMIWCALAAIAVGISILSRANRWQPIAAAAGLILVSLVGVAYLRSWAFLAAAWATGLAVWFFKPARPVVVRSLCTLLWLFVPVISGLGVAGISYIHHNTSNLGYERTVLAEGAKSAFVHPKIVRAGTTTTTPAKATTAPTATPETIPSAVANEELVVPQGLKNDLRALPGGLIAFALRPFPWQHGAGPSYDFAAFEELLYYPLYVLALVGLVACRRRRDLIAFPFLAIVFISGIASEAEGNVGSAFRHRDQLLWAVVYLATLGTYSIYQRWRHHSRSAFELSLPARGDRCRLEPVVLLADTDRL